MASQNVEDLPPYDEPWSYHGEDSVMASQNVEAISPCKEHSKFYHEEDPVNSLMFRMMDVANSVNEICGEMGGLFRTLIECVKYQDVQREDYRELVDKINMYREQMEAKDYLELVDIINEVRMLFDTPEA
jgi:hypothetical protein